jgi:hypothetical protein
MFGALMGCCLKSSTIPKPLGFGADDCTTLLKDVKSCNTVNYIVLARSSTELVIVMRSATVIGQPLPKPIGPYKKMTSFNNIQTEHVVKYVQRHITFCLK